jgi:hypothetical protein
MRYILFLMLFSGCSVGHSPPEKIEEVGGCTVYKVDGGRHWIYTTICPNRSQTDWNTREGKVTKHHTVQTVTK